MEFQRDPLNRRVDNFRMVQVS